MNELETQLLKIIEEQQQQLLQQQKQLQEQQQTLEFMQKRVLRGLLDQSIAIESDQGSLKKLQESLATIQQKFYELENNTASYTEQINGKVKEMSQITADNQDALEKISSVQHSALTQYEQAQQNLLETSEILKRILSK